MAVTLSDCEELAAEEGHANKWETAMHYASLMLPAIFRPSDPVMQVHFASNDRIELEEIIVSIEDSIFQAEDSLGWVYQYWQSEEKKRIEEEEKSGQKIDGERLPAKTQLFTEDYMVEFLIDNSIGAWWVSRNPGVEPPVKFEYLRRLEDGTPAAGKFEGWPDKTALLTCLDPCMGSGHFVVSLFLVLVKLRMQEEKLSKDEATDRVIKENLHGLEIDPRCTQIAAFNLALTAWKFCGHYKELPEMNLACSGIAPKGKEEDWVKLVGKVHRDDQVRMENGMRQLYRHFQLAPELGSLLNPNIIRPDLQTAGFELLKPVLEKALESESDYEQLERGVMAAGITKAGQLLANRYTLQITNVPYLSRSKQDEKMADYLEKFFSESKSDLATVFLEKMISSNCLGGSTCVVMPQNWLFTTPYKKIRKKLLESKSWNLLAKLGSKAFQTPMWDFNVLLLTITNLSPSQHHKFNGLDVSSYLKPDLKDTELKTVKISQVLQINQKNNPDYRVILESFLEKTLLSDYSNHSLGVSSGDSIRFYKKIWEIFPLTEDWRFIQSTVSKTTFFDGCDNIILWENGNGELYKFVVSKIGKERAGSWLRGHNAWGKPGVLVSSMSKLPVCRYLGGLFDENTVVITPKDTSNLEGIWSFCSSIEFSKEVRKGNQKLNVRGDLIKIPFNIEEWNNFADTNYPIGLPDPYSDDPTQWLFHGHPFFGENSLQVALARMLGYRWPAESDPEMELDPRAREFIQEIQAFDHLSDADGIFCIPSVNGEAAGVDRLRDYIQTVWGKEYGIDTISKLLEQEGASAKNLEAWLRDEFFAQHCKVFNNRPFIWHIWDGRKDGFSVLVNYHKLTKSNLSKLIYTYLGDWIRMCEAKKKSGESGADGLLSAALKLKESLELILEGEKPYDIFVRWKTLAEQPIGWDPDLNDGVRLNIRPFMEANILRKKPNIKWGVDRGKNPPGAPWGEERNNDLHLSLEEKRKARTV
ncbi:Eco57I restriction-modification methylase domain-containing protein [Mariniradius saccharolyticus]|uniref:Eco57I restriction-modification methylase domain-containing protein n=1 Tax=Mariniradius saccharolyticus TaxID=1245591 RepID=UPI001FDF2426|nr:N-6 DNA methylase [Mariniradius saccharolyticus]